MFELQISPITRSQVVDKAGNLYSGIRSWAILNYSIIMLKENETYNVFMLPCLVQKKPWLPTTQKKESLCFVLFFYHTPIQNIFGVKKVKIKKKKKNLLAKFPGTKIIYGLPWV